MILKHYTQAVVNNIINQIITIIKYFRTKRWFLHKLPCNHQVYIQAYKKHLLCQLCDLYLCGICELDRDSVESCFSITLPRYVVMPMLNFTWSFCKSSSHFYWAIQNTIKPFLGCGNLQFKCIIQRAPHFFMQGSGLYVHVYIW